MLNPELKHLSVFDTGHLNGAPVVLIHAFPLNKNMWEEQVAVFKTTNRVITFDIRGLGQSKSDCPYTMESVVDDLIQLLDHLQIAKSIVVGLSMGGYVALRAVERNRERFSSLVLADTKSEADNDKAKLARHESLKTIRTEGLSEFVDGFMKNAISEVVRNDRPEIFENAKQMAKTNHVDGVAAALLALMSRTDTTKSLTKIKIPTLILHGELDAIIPLDSAKAMQAKIKNSTLETIPMAGHLSNLENPEAFNVHLKRFIDANNFTV